MDYGQPQYGYSSQHSRGSGSGMGTVGGMGRSSGVPGGPQMTGYGTQQSNVAPSPSGIARVDRSAQINDYVAKQKAAKLNAPLIKKENQRLAEARVMSASRSTKSSDPSDEYIDDHSHLAPPSAHDYDRNGGRPVSGVRQMQQQQQQQSHMQDPNRRQSGGQPMRTAQKTVTYESDRDPSNGGGSGGGSNAELQRRVGMLEEQIRLLKQQNRIFLSFMQNTEQQLAELRAAPQHQAPPPVERSRSRAADPSPNGYPNNMSQSTKQVLQRSQSERQTQPPASAATQQAAVARAKAGSPSLNGRGGPLPLGGADEVDQTFAPLDDDRDREKDRSRSAKKKPALMNLREKMAQKQQQAAQPEDSRGRAYSSGSYQDREYEDEPSRNSNPGYGYGGGGGAAQPSARNPPPQHQAAPRSAAPAARAPPSASASTRRPPPPEEYPSSHDYPDPNDSFGGGGGGGVPPGADEEVETFPCPNCERRFNEKALEKHIAKQLCKQKPRKVFNMAQKRLEDLAAEAREAGIKLPVKPIPAGSAAAASGGQAPTSRPKQDQPLKKPAKWRVEHERFMAAILAGKRDAAAVAAGVPLSSLPPPPAAREEDDDRTPCPHCGRKFQSNVADRHIPHCKNTKNKPKANVASAARLGSTARKR